MRTIAPGLKKAIAGNLALRRLAALCLENQVTKRGLRECGVLAAELLCVRLHVDLLRTCPVSPAAALGSWRFGMFVSIALVLECEKLR